MTAYERYKQRKISVLLNLLSLLSGVILGVIVGMAILMPSDDTPGYLHATSQGFSMGFDSGLMDESSFK